MNEFYDLAQNSKAWPFREALKLLKRVQQTPPEKGYVLFETGYGPSGLPHIGTFAEVARTTMVRNAFAKLSDMPTKLFCFSDDMDGLRKVPGNIPNREMVAEHLGKPLTRIPDPFGEFDSFGAHNNARLKQFLDTFGFEYDFVSSTECYTSGRFDEALLKILRNYELVINVILPTLGEERRKTYSPFLPICPKTGVVLQVPLKGMDAEKGTITFEDSEGEDQTIPVTGGTCKLQWKVDWAMRWYSLEVDYEMCGKDLIESVKLSSVICKLLGRRPPEDFIFELFLDENGEKISKSKGNGITLEEWLRYASAESLSLYLYQKPTSAKRLYFDVIPKTVDEYYTFVGRFHGQDEAARLDNPAWHIHGGKVPNIDVPISFSLLLNLVGTAQTHEKDMLWGFVGNYLSGATPENHPELDKLLDYAIKYYEDFVAPTKNMRVPTEQEKKALKELLEGLEGMDDDVDAEVIQTLIYDIGKNQNYENLRDWFKALYEILLGQSQGPRMGTFIKIFGRREMCALIKKVIS